MVGNNHEQPRIGAAEGRPRASRGPGEGPGAARAAEIPSDRGPAEGPGTTRATDGQPTDNQK
eukprot:344793-Pyramimonas_sp.AAC.1